MKTKILRGVKQPQIHEKILMSINPEFAKKIISGEKKYEYRRVIPSRISNIKHIVIYETYPIQQVSAEIEVVGFCYGTPEMIWKQTYKNSGITKEFFDKYCEGCNNIIAYKLGDIRLFDIPLTLQDYNLKFPPQSFVYLD